jgi:hypothetical protein
MFPGFPTPGFGELFACHQAPSLDELSPAPEVEDSFS